jgi:general secretion pathway protein G
MKRSISRRFAFTLLEIMLVVMIIALLAGLAIWGLGDNLWEAQRTKVRADIVGFKTQLMMYEASNCFPPTTEQGLKALVTRPESEPKPRNWRQYLPSLPLDPWGQQYRYLQPGKHNSNGYDLFSTGKDRTPETPDDIGNWDQDASG